MKTFAPKISLVILLFSLCLMVKAQNVGINGTGAAPSGDAMLDISSTNKGLLIPRVSIANLSTIAPITGGSTTSLLVYNTNAGTGLGYYYWDGSAWVNLSGDDWKITGNSGTTYGTNFLGTTDAQGLDFRTNNTIRLRIPNANQVHANANGTAALPFYSWAADANTGMWSSAADRLNFSTAGTERFEMSTTEAVFNDVSGSYDFRVESNGLTQALLINGANDRIGFNNPGTTAGDFVASTATAANQWAINGYNTQTIGSGIYGNTTSNANTYSAIEGSKSGTPASGGGVYGIGYTLGTLGLANSAGNGVYGGYFSTNFGDYAYVGGWQGPQRKIVGAGTVNTVINDMDNKRVLMCAPEAPEVLFMDYGVGQLTGGKTHVDMDPVFAKNLHVDKDHPIKIFVQLEGDCNGVYVTNKSANGFDVIELNGGTSNVSFSWSVVGNRANEVYTYSNGKTRVSDYASERFGTAPPYIKPKTRSGVESEIQVESITTSSVNQ